MRPAPSRIPLFRPPPLRLVLAVVLALLAGLAVHRATARAAATTATYGELAPAWVVAEPVRAGEPIAAGAAERVERPADHVPAGAVGDDPTGRLAVADLVPGELVLDGRLADGRRSGAAALVPEGWRAIALPVREARLPVEPGHRVDVVAVLDTGSRSGGSVLAADAIVVHAEERATTVAVPAERVPDITAAMVSGYVFLALVA